MADGDVLDQKTLEREALKDLLTLPPLLAAVLTIGRNAQAGAAPMDIGGVPQTKEGKRA